MVEERRVAKHQAERKPGSWPWPTCWTTRVVMRHPEWLAQPQEDGQGQSPLAQPGRACRQARHLRFHPGGLRWPARPGALCVGRRAGRPCVPRSGEPTTWAGSGPPRTMGGSQASRPGVSWLPVTRVVDSRRPRRADLGVDVFVDVWGQGPVRHGQVGGRRHRDQRLTGGRRRSWASTSSSSCWDSLLPCRRGRRRGASRIGDSASLA